MRIKAPNSIPHVAYALSFQFLIETTNCHLYTLIFKSKILHIPLSQLFRVTILHHIPFGSYSYVHFTSSLEATDKVFHTGTHDWLSSSSVQPQTSGVDACC